jgi:hypothetical protein
MGLWPFNRDPADVEIASRVVTAETGDGAQVRGKLTLHFLEPQTQAAADEAADRCAALMEALLHEQRRHDDLLGTEAAMVLKLIDRLPGDVVPTRSIDLAALHVVGDPGSLVRKRSSTLTHMAAVPAALPPPSTVAPSSAAASSSVSNMSTTSSRRRSSSRMRALAGSLVLPVGSSPQAIGGSLALVVGEAAARLLIGFLRIHDLVNVRGVALDESSQDLVVAAVATILEPPQGEPEASRAAEVSRWEAALGTVVLSSLRREACVVSASQMFAALLHAEIPQNLALEIMVEGCAKAFPGEPSLAREIGRYEGDGTSIAAVLSMRITRILGGGRKPEAMIATLEPLVGSGDEDLAVAATLAKYALGI